MQKEYYQADQSPRAMTGTKQGVRLIDSDLQKSVIKMPFLMRGNSVQKQRCQLPTVTRRSQGQGRDLL